MSVRTSGRTPVLLLAFFVWLGALAAEASVHDRHVPVDDVKATSGGAAGVAGGATGATTATTTTSTSSHPDDELPVMTTSGPLSPTSRTSPRLLGRPDIGPLPFDHFERSAMLWNGHHALLVPRPIPQGAILYHGSLLFEKSALGTMELWLSPQSSAALAAAVKKCFPRPAEAHGPCPETCHRVQLLEFVVATDALNVVYLPHSALKVQEALNIYTSGTAGSPFHRVTMNQPSDGLDTALREFCNVHVDVRASPFFGWRSPFDQDEVMVCRWVSAPSSPMSPHLRSATLHRSGFVPTRPTSFKPVVRRHTSLGGHASAPPDLESPLADLAPPQRPDPTPPAPGHGADSPAQLSPLQQDLDDIHSAAGSPVSATLTAGPLVLRREFACDPELIRQLLDEATRVGILANARGTSFTDCNNIMETTFNFDQVKDPSLQSMSTTGSRNWGALSSFHMQLADGLSISQLLTPWVEGKEAPCSQVHDYRADIDRSLELEPLIWAGSTERF